MKVTEGGDPYYPDMQLYLSPASFGMDMGLYLPYIYNYDQAVRPGISIIVSLLAIVIMIVMFICYLSLK